MFEPNFWRLYLFKVQSSVLTLEALKTDEDPQEIDFFTKQARLQIEARMALAQAKDIAHMQMEVSILSENVCETVSLYEVMDSNVCLYFLFYFFFTLDGTAKANKVTNHKHDPPNGRESWIQFSG